MSKATVLTVADETYLSRWAFCITSQDAYAARHGFQRVIRREPVEGLNMKWSKFTYATELLRQGREVLLLDADVELAEDAPSFQAVMNEVPGAGIFYVLGISGRANSGVLMLRGAAGAALLESCLAARETPVARPHRVTADGENGHLIAALASGAFTTTSQVLPLAWNCTLPEHATEAHARHYTNKLRQALMASAA